MFIFDEVLFHCIYCVIIALLCLHFPIPFVRCFAYYYFLMKKKEMHVFYISLGPGLTSSIKYFYSNENLIFKDEIV